MNYICICAAGIFSFIIARFYYRHKEKKLLDRLAKMIDSSIEGNFIENMFDESMLSAVETKFYQYLRQCEVSSKNLNEEKEKIKELISDIAHQTKTPLSNVLLYSQLLCEQNLSKESKRCVDALTRQAEKLNFLISSLIKTSRLETGIVKVNPKKNNVGDMIKDINTQISGKIKEKNISLLIETCDAEAVYDKKWTTEAFYNILDNAVKYTANGGNISIKVTPYTLFCRIDIKDDGIGISEKEQCKIFKRFYRAENVSDIEGVGLGLFLARKIITAEEGYIKVSSEQGKGSLFSVFLPMEK